MSDSMQLLIDLHLPGERQGPGSDACTERAIELAGLNANTPLNIADIGCGTGAASLVLARQLNAQITAVDFLAPFLAELRARAKAQGLEHRLTTLCASMERLPFEAEQYDVIWSEGAVYNIGFEQGLKDWRGYLKPDGLMVLSEISWLTDSRPAELDTHWTNAYAEIDTIANKIDVIKRQGYSLVDHFVLPENCWMQHYYQPMMDRFDAFLAEHSDSAEARAIVESEKAEMALFQRYKDQFAYVMYIAKKTAD